MYRYIAFCWNKQIEDRQTLVNKLVTELRSRLEQWECVLASDGLEVYQLSETPHSHNAYVLDANSGVVLGTLFRRKIVESDCAPNEASLGTHECTRIRESGGRHLVDQYWGRYVALLRDGDGARVRILRDPSGAMPCQMTKFRGIQVVCSHIEDCASIGIVNAAINWDHVAAFLWFHRLVTRETGLNAVFNVMAGECVTICGDRTEYASYWDPATIYNVRTLEVWSEAIREVRDIVQYCVEAWASCYGSILHELSGGLDSAVVLACLSRTVQQQDIACHNFYTEDAEGDERKFARRAANYAGVELFEEPLRSYDLSLDSIIDCTRVTTPALTQLKLESRSGREALVGSRGVEVVFSGQGGDHLFQRDATRLIAAEYASRHGLRSALVQIIGDTSRFTKKSIWSVAAAVVYSGLLRRNYDPYLQRMKPPPFVSQATRDALNLSRVRHPWVDGANYLPAGKILQILNIVDSQNFYNASFPGTDTVHPLISQPILELCLQIPSYVLTYGGVDRALVRDAFVKSVPPEIARRTSKGGTTAYVHRQLVRNISLFRNVLLDGVLVQSNVLDRGMLQSNLTERNLVQRSQLLFPMLSAVRAEMWLRTWSSNNRQLAA